MGQGSPQPEWQPGEEEVAEADIMLGFSVGH